MKNNTYLFIIFLLVGVIDSVEAFETSLIHLKMEFCSVISDGGIPEEMPTDTQFIQLGVLVGQMKFDKSHLKVKQGSIVSIVFNNNGIMIHNVLVLRPGSKDKVGMAADKMISQKDAIEKNYIPDMDEVLFHTPLVDPGREFKLVFKVPEEKGEYPFICTFPGHWRIMQGVLEVN